MKLNPTSRDKDQVTNALILIAVAFGAILPLLPKTLFPMTAGGGGLLLFLSLILRKAPAVHLTLLTFLTAVWIKIWPPFWPFYLLGPLAIYMLMVGLFPQLRRSTMWLRRGKFDPAVGRLVGFTIVISSFFLILWYILWQPDLSPWLAAVPKRSPVMLWAAGLGFAVINATIEECIFRGILLQGLDTVLGEGFFAVAIQAVSFGIIHIMGIPNGWMGMGMAVIYGLLLGLIRRRSQGLFAPIVAHFFADAVIFFLLVLCLR